MNRREPSIYLDFSATTPVDPEVSAVVHEQMMHTVGNASSVHSFGRTAKVILEESRERIAASIRAEPSEVFFTSGGTEADNHALVGTALARKRTKNQDHVIVSSIEHHAVLDCAEYLRELGFSISFIPVDSDAIVDTDALRKALRPSTAIVSVMHVNNEVGSIQPLNEIADIVHEYDCTFHTDAVQSYGKIPFSVSDSGIDLAALSAHKIYGPKGIGALYIRKGTDIDALIHGGAQERKNRAGTENIPLIAGFAKGVELMEIGREALYHQAMRQKSLLLKNISTSCEHVIVNGSKDTTVPHIVSVSLDASAYDVEGESMLLNMDLKGIAVSSGSACTSGSVQPSHVLLAMGRDVRTTQATIRFSIGRGTTDKEIERAGETFCLIADQFRRTHR
ncbi:MAG: cysteine desulfurase family protein [Bacteroidota bacterium]